LGPSNSGSSYLDGQRLRHECHPTYWLHSADEDGVLWLTSYGSWHAYEKKKWFFYCSTEKWTAKKARATCAFSPQNLLPQ